VFFIRQQLSNKVEYQTLCSVKGISQMELTGRAIVKHKGLHPATGKWKCSKDAKNQKCPHIEMACEAMLGFVGDSEEDGEDGLPSLDALPGPAGELPILLC
jgi:hypothetical protein